MHCRSDRPRSACRNTRGDPGGTRGAEVCSVGFASMASTASFSVLAVSRGRCSRPRRYPRRFEDVLGCRRGKRRQRDDMPITAQRLDNPSFPSNHRLLVLAKCGAGSPDLAEARDKRKFAAAHGTGPSGHRKVRRGKIRALLRPPRPPGWVAEGLASSVALKVTMQEVNFSQLHCCMVCTRPIGRAIRVTTRCGSVAVPTAKIQGTLGRPSPPQRPSGIHCASRRLVCCLTRSHPWPGNNGAAVIINALLPEFPRFGRARQSTMDRL